MSGWHRPPSSFRRRATPEPSSPSRHRRRRRVSSAPTVVSVVVPTCESPSISGPREPGGDATRSNGRPGARRRRPAVSLASVFRCRPSAGVGWRHRPLSPPGAAERARLGVSASGPRDAANRVRVTSRTTFGWRPPWRPVGGPTPPVRVAARRRRGVAPVRPWVRRARRGTHEPSAGPVEGPVREDVTLAVLAPRHHAPVVAPRTPERGRHPTPERLAPRATLVTVPVRRHGKPLRATPRTPVPRDTAAPARPDDTHRPPALAPGRRRRREPHELESVGERRRRPGNDCPARPSRPVRPSPSAHRGASHRAPATPAVGRPRDDAPRGTPPRRPVIGGPSRPTPSRAPTNWPVRRHAKPLRAPPRRRHGRSPAGAHRGTRELAGVAPDETLGLRPVTVPVGRDPRSGPRHARAPARDASPRPPPGVGSGRFGRGSATRRCASRDTA